MGHSNPKLQITVVKHKGGNGRPTCCTGSTVVGCKWLVATVENRGTPNIRTHLYDHKCCHVTVIHRVVTIILSFSQCVPQPLLFQNLSHQITRHILIHAFLPNFYVVN